MTLLLGGLLALAARGAPALDLPPTPLAAAHYARISSAAEILADLDALAAATPLARREVVGSSVEQRPIATLVLSSARDGTHRPSVLLVGSQHGAAEPAGGEAMLLLARDLVAGDLRGVLEHFDVVLLPDANPDGRDHGHRSNAHRVNLNTDFVRLDEPESQALVAALDRYRPLAVLDVHESAVLKRQTLAREGYITDFDAQFEAANNPAIPAATRDYGQQRLLPRLVAAVSAAGLPAQRYIGEITSTRQPITNGGLTLRNFRNRAGIEGAVAVLVETRLDVRDDHFPTWRNIGARVERSLTCQRAFLRAVDEARDELHAVVEAGWRAMATEPVTLAARYIEDPGHPRVALPLRKLAGRERVMVDFADHRAVASEARIPMPATYVIPAPDDALRAVLERQGIRYERQSQALQLPVLAERFVREPGGAVRLAASGQRMLATGPGALIIDLVQRRGRLVPLLLDPRSVSSLFAAPPFAALLDGGEFGVYRVYKGVLRGAPALE